mgnify:CR=1 FL=1
MQIPDWIAVDWGTSNMRAWAMSASGSVLAEVRSEKGMSDIAPDQFEPVLRNATAGWIIDSIPIIACGMVGARQGWAEARYARVPCTVTPVKFTQPNSALDVHIIPGLMQSDPADVMRGEETQIAGFLSMNKNWDGVVCLPGTHTKWAHVSADEVVSFQTYMTGELFAAIGDHTILRHSVQSDAWDNAAFDAGVNDSISRPERLAARLFSVRAEGLVNNIQNSTSRARLSGLLIGAELAGAKPYWLGQQIAVIGAVNLTALYVRALALQSVPATHVKGDAITLAGLIAAYRRLKG